VGAAVQVARRNRLGLACQQTGVKRCLPSDSNELAPPTPTGVSARFIVGRASAGWSMRSLGYQRRDDLGFGNRPVVGLAIQIGAAQRAQAPVIGDRDAERVSAGRAVDRVMDGHA
jgi:hypothetical protein